MEEANVKVILERELSRSKPDYVTYMPKHFNGSQNDSLNEHFLVFDGPDGSMMAIWTQASYSAGTGKQINRIRYSRSADEGVTWAEPQFLIGARNNEDTEYMASWAFPMVSRSGRIYVLYNRYIGISGREMMHTGVMEGIYSDDCGYTWSKPQRIPMPKSPYDDPKGIIPGEWIVWQIPARDKKGRFFVGYTHWVNLSVAHSDDVSAWTHHESVCEFMRFENIDENPETKDIRVNYFGWGDKALRVPHFQEPWLSVAQEPSIVRLPDNRLFCTMRTNSGYIWYSVSKDDGETWCNPRPLLRKDYGQPILQPVSCCPIYMMHDRRYILLHHNNRGGEKRNFPRNPAFIALGEFRPGADQPVWFSESKQLMDHEGYGVNGIKFGQPGSFRCPDIGVYSSFTTRKGNSVLWHPDRKFFLVGKKITKDFLADLQVPDME